jgi:hypothetical protein
MKLGALIALSCCFVLACNSLDKESDLNVVLDFLENRVGIDSKVQYCLIIPSSGCGGCITSVEKILLSTSQKPRPDLIFVLTGFTSDKAIRIHYGESILKNEQVLIDREGILIKQLPNGMYPKLVYFEGGKPHKIEDISPDNRSDLLRNLR